jgi:hypothetical protein
MRRHKQRLGGCKAVVGECKAEAEAEAKRVQGRG